ncbi:unnamed protein product [Urochloa decumbens]|uniref:DUF1618 domain-containing protein n=1 Tax=Urochloa decumbens TaxID=240449 RepID=A0ABC9C7N0_9POAL
MDLAGTQGEVRREARAEICSTGGGGESTEAPAIGGQQGMSMQAILETMKPDPGVSDPPEISQLRMVRQMKVGGGPPGGVISSTDKALVVLYAGLYRPGFSTTPSSGCHLVYNASSNSLPAIPQLPDPHTFSGLGLGAAVLSRGEGRYLLAELVETNSGFPDATLFLWQCPNPTQRQWIRKPVRLPPQVFVPDYDIRVDMAFSDDIMLRSWTLSRDLKLWEGGTALSLRDLWTSESFRERDLPQIAPLRPVISVDKDEVVYLVLNEVDRVDALDSYGNVSGVEIVPKAHYVLRIDTVQKKILQSTKVIPNNMTPQFRFPDLIASELSAYLQS